ncbi:DNA (cytosine-5)-methyltransferase 1 [Desulfohalotomaculum tongense]|uniref:DNA cytosine methyltransferase n=1 Tax=Desulforadius tongensis TaxID=1216062 RepID=UPI00195B7FDA|nr:DNA cytosine methyltransferase [Desulforadius tongensis]MBM7854319.1 DNA (cytosine-5)-methyltransferase 1 [Desulforadius tongensis]
MSSESIKPTAIDIFSGAGGITCALKDAGFNVLCGIELDEVIAESYKLNYSSKIIINDIRKVTLEDLISACGVTPGELDLLAGCPPCQGFSKQNVKKGKKDLRNYLVFQYYRMVRLLKPKYIFMENVPGIQRHKYIFDKFIELLETGWGRKDRPLYYVHYDVVNAADYGVPQNRLRFVLIGKRRDIALNESEAESIFAKPTHINPELLTEDCGLKKWVTLKETISHLKKIKAGETCKEDKLHRAANLSELNLLRMKYTPKNGGSRTDWPQTVRNDKGEQIELWLKCHKKRGVGYKDVYGRMDYNKVAPTLTGGCCTISKGRFGHPVEDRAISLREAALIQTFPPDYKFTGSFGKIALQIGNAVPVKMGRTFFECIRKDIEKDV